MLSLTCGILKTQQSREYYKKEAGSLTQRTNKWLPEWRRGHTGARYQEMQAVRYKVSNEGMSHNIGVITNIS